MHYEHFLYLKNFSEMNLKVGGVGQNPPKWPFWLFSLTFKVVIGVCAAKVPDLQPKIYIRMTEQSCFQAISSLYKLVRKIGKWAIFFWKSAQLPNTMSRFVKDEMAWKQLCSVILMYIVGWRCVLFATPTPMTTLQFSENSQNGHF